MSKAAIRERDIERFLVRYFKALGGEVRKVQWLGRAAAPDRFVMLPATETRPARQVWVELKAPGEKPTPAQLREHARMRACGCDVRVIDSHSEIFEFVREVAA